MRPLYQILLTNETIVSLSSKGDYITILVELAAKYEVGKPCLAVCTTQGIATSCRCRSRTSFMPGWRNYPPQRSTVLYGDVRFDETRIYPTKPRDQGFGARGNNSISIMPCTAEPLGCELVRTMFPREVSFYPSKVASLVSTVSPGLHNHAVADDDFPKWRHSGQEAPHCERFRGDV